MRFLKALFGVAKAIVAAASLINHARELLQQILALFKVAPASAA